MPPMSKPHEQRIRPESPELMKQHQAAVLKKAKEYIGRGWKVFPVHTITEDGACSCGSKTCTDQGKHPRTDNGFKAASDDAEQIEKWFGPDAPPSNIGIVTGEVSGITVIDIDIGDGKQGAETFHELTKEHGDPDTLVAETGSGGMHYVFRYNSALKTASNVLGPGVDVRNDGGFVVAAPSRHRSGGVYFWLNWGKEPANLPAHLSKKKETRGRPRKDDITRHKYQHDEVRGMLEVIPADDRDFWRSVGIILGRHFNRDDEAWQIYIEWAGKWGGKEGRNHSEIMRQAFYETSQQDSEKNLTIGTIVKAALDNGWVSDQHKPSADGAVYDASADRVIDVDTGSSMTVRVANEQYAPKNESGKIELGGDWAKKHNPFFSKTSDPNLPSGLNRDIGCRQNGEMFSKKGVNTYNTYRKPTIELGDAKKAQPFEHHLRLMLNKPGDADQFLDYMAHRAQKPGEKPRFALMLAGGQGVGKDTAVEMCCPAIGTWNVANIDPLAFESPFNEHLASTLVRINEASNLHEMSKWAFNENTKVMIAGNPDHATINPKYGQKFSVRMHCGVILTTNHMLSGIYIPADDRRYDVIDCATLDEMGLSDSDTRRAYFADLWEWFNTGGASHIAAFLHERDISRFSASNGQRKTEAHRLVVQAGMTGDHWLGDIIDELGNPTAVRADWIVQRAVTGGEKEADVRRKLANSIARLGYVPFRSPTTKDGRWKIGGKNVVVYVQQGTPSSFDPTTELDKEPF